GAAHVDLGPDIGFHHGALAKVDVEIVPFRQFYLRHEFVPFARTISNHLKSFNRKVDRVGRFIRKINDFVLKIRNKPGTTGGKAGKGEGAKRWISSPKARSIII